MTVILGVVVGVTVMLGVTVGVDVGLGTGTGGFCDILTSVPIAYGSNTRKSSVILNLSDSSVTSTIVPVYGNMDVGFIIIW